MFNLESLNKGERFIFDWQYRLAGSFKMALAEAIMRADTKNIAKLALGFPDEVKAYIAFSTESGWWEAVEKKAGR